MIKLLSSAAAAALLVLGSAAIAQEAPITTHSGSIAAAPADRAQVVFFRPGSMMGMVPGCTVHENGREIARLGNGKYYVVTVAPGTHDFSTAAETHDHITVETEAGETYFVRCKIGMGIMAGRPNLSPADRAAFTQRAGHLSAWTPDADWESHRAAAATAAPTATATPAAH